MSITNGFAGVSNCYVFKSRLQEYAQKEGFPTPMYDTLKSGPSHEPYFQSTVIVNDVKYDSLPGFSNRKAAEQSAAEVALVELLKSGDTKGSIAHPVHDTGLCKNLLQEYAQKMNFAIPMYTCVATEPQGKKTTFTCTVDIGGIQYIGAGASSKKEAEIKAARTALLAIQSSPTGAVIKPGGSGELTVLPCKRKGEETETQKEKCEKPLKPKKADFKKKHSRRKFSDKKAKQANGNAESSSAVQVENQDTVEADQDGHGSELMETEGNLPQQVTVTEPDSSQNGVTVPMHVKPEENQDVHVGEHDEQAVLEVNLHEQVIKTEPNSSQDEITVAMGSKPEANEDVQGSEKPLKPKKADFKKKHLRRKFSDKKAKQANGKAESSSAVQVENQDTVEADQDGDGSERMVTEGNLHQQVTVTEPDSSQSKLLQAVLEVNLHEQVIKTEPNSSQDEVTVAMGSKPEANEDVQGSEKPLKPKKADFKKKHSRRRKFSDKKAKQANGKAESSSAVQVENQDTVEADQDGDQDVHGGAHDEHAVLEVSLHEQVTKTEPKSSQYEVTVAMDSKPEANEDVHGGDNAEQAVLEVNLHQEVPVNEAAGVSPVSQIGTTEMMAC